MKLVIVESPFGAGLNACVVAGEERPGISHAQIQEDLISRNIAYARACVADCIARGESPIASHLLLTQPGILNDNLPNDRERGIEAGLAWYSVADACVVYGDFGISAGMERGIARAKKARVPVEARKLDIGSGATVQDLADQHEPFGGSGVIQDGGVKTLDEVLALGAASEARRIAEELVLEGVSRELAGDRRGGRALVEQGERIRWDADGGGRGLG